MRQWEDLGRDSIQLGRPEGDFKVKLIDAHHSQTPELVALEFV